MPASASSTKENGSHFFVAPCTPLGEKKNFFQNFDQRIGAGSNHPAFNEEQEDVRSECIDRRKWSTFNTICLKDYLKDDDQDG